MCQRGVGHHARSGYAAEGRHLKRCMCACCCAAAGRVAGNLLGNFAIVCLKHKNKNTKTMYNKCRHYYTYEIAGWQLQLMLVVVHWENGPHAARRPNACACLLACQSNLVSSLHAGGQGAQQALAGRAPSRGAAPRQPLAMCNYILQDAWVEPACKCAVHVCSDEV